MLPGAPCRLVFVCFATWQTGSRAQDNVHMSQPFWSALLVPWFSFVTTWTCVWLQVYKARLRGMQDVAVKVACACDLADGSWLTWLRKEVAMLQKVGKQPPPCIPIVGPTLLRLVTVGYTAVPAAPAEACLHADTSFRLDNRGPFPVCTSACGSPPCLVAAKDAMLAAPTNWTSQVRRCPSTAT